MRRLVTLLAALALVAPAGAQLYPNQLQEAGKDLGITSLEIDFPGKGRQPIAPGTPVTVRVTVRNNDSSASPPYNLIITCCGATVHQEKAGKIFPGRAQVHTAVWTPAKEEACALVARIVPTGKAGYDDSRNNMITMQVAVGQPPQLAASAGPGTSDQPDLKIDSLYLKKLDVKEAKMLDIYVGNAGGSSVRQSVKVLVEVGDSFTRTLTLSGGVAAGDSQKLQVEIPLNYSRQGATVKVTVDPDDQIEEANEANNSSSKRA